MQTSTKFHWQQDFADFLARHLCTSWQCRWK